MTCSLLTATCHLAACHGLPCQALRATDCHRGGAPTYLLTYLTYLAYLLTVTWEARANAWPLRTVSQPDMPARGGIQESSRRTATPDGGVCTVKLNL